MAGLPEHQVVELLRHVAWTTLSVEVEGDTVMQLVEGIYAAGGADALLGVATIAKAHDIGVNVVLLGEDSHE